jgi:hypothetical protein
MPPNDHRLDEVTETTGSFVQPTRAANSQGGRLEVALGRRAQRFEVNAE